MGQRRAWAWGAVLGGLALGGCTPMLTPGYRSLHEVDGQVVHSYPPPPSAYEAYLRARLAMEQQPPQLEVAAHYIRRAIKADSRDPHLWATRAEIEEGLGKIDQAKASAQRALTLRPGYPPAQRVLTRLEGGAVSARAGSGAPHP